MLRNNRGLEESAGSPKSGESDEDKASKGCGFLGRRWLRWQRRRLLLATRRGQ
jgi:hypothetical protein